MTRGPVQTTKSVAATPPRLRVQVASDLHLEFIQRRFPNERVIKPLPDADLLVLAGDVTNGLGILDAFGDWPVPIFYVIGNHESYGRVYDQDRKTLRAACAGSNDVLLDQDVVTSSDLAVRFPAWASSLPPHTAKCEVCWLHVVDGLPVLRMRQEPRGADGRR